jgi:hypothetical protein
MPASATVALADWRDFFLLAGTAAATLVGAMFVVASIGSGFLTRRHGPQIRAFLTPTAIHLSSILFAAMLTAVPGLGGRLFNLALLVGALAGALYSARIGLAIARRRLEWSDRLWYALVPLVGYGVVLLAALAGLLLRTASPEALAIGIALLLAAGIRNAWDMIIFFVAQSGDRP